MRLLFVLRLEVNPKSGGVERVTHVLTHYFIQQGIEVYFLYFRIKNISFPEYNKNIKTFFLPDTITINTKENIDFFKNLLIKNKIDIVINQGNVADSITAVIAESVKNTRSRIISIFHNSPLTFRQFLGMHKQTSAMYLAVEEKSLKSFVKGKFLVLVALNEYINFYKKYFKIALESSDHFVVLSKGYIPLLCRILKTKSQDKIIAIANPSSFNDEFAVLDINNKKNQVLYVGRLDYYFKRIDRLLHVWKTIESDFPEWELIIVGGSLHTDDKNDYQVKELERLKSISESLHLQNVRFAGNTNPVPYYESGSLLCLTSNNEGFPMVLIEAMQFAVVPVAFGSFEAIYDIIEHYENGMIATPFNLSEFASSLRELMTNENKRRSMAINAMTTSKKYNVSVIGNKWIDLFKKTKGL